MDDLTLFVAGCVVCFVFAGGMLIHTVANQKLAETESTERDDEDLGTKVQKPND